MGRMRIDLAGVPLKDAGGRVLCIFRYRTTEGLIVNLPESVDVSIPWTAIEIADLDLKSGRVRIKFVADGRPRWLGEAVEVEGAWTDRELLRTAPR